MKTIGLLGGMTCESSLEYYRLINAGMRQRLGGIHSAKSLMVSVDFAEIRPLMEAGDWEAVLENLAAAAQQIERGGADFLVICTNTMHKLADALATRCGLPILNLIDVTAQAIQGQGLTTVGLLGTRFTMTQDFYRQRLAERFGIQCVIPTEADVDIVHRVIMEELTIGRLVASSKAEYWRIIHDLARRGAQGVILGCTEIPLLIKQDEGAIPLFDTTALHAAAAVDWALA